MFFSNKKIILFVGCFLSYGFVSADTNSDAQNIDYQKEAEKYKKLYEKYQKLADESNKKDTAKTSKAESKEAVENKAIEKKPTEPVKKEVSTPKEIVSDAITEPWKGTNFGLGGTIATGDSATTNINALANVNYKPMEKWNNKLFFNYVYSRDNRAETRAVKINKAQVRAETSWDFTKLNGAYGRLTYLNDELSSYDYIFTESVGYKRRLFDNEKKTMYIDISAGPSFMQSRITGKDFQASEPGFQATFDYVWNFTDKSNFKQNLLYNYDQKNRSVYQSISALSVELYKNFSLQLTFQLNGTTLVVPGKENINTLTSTNIMYNL
ncbi:DUF481 domain-containing protein [Francisella adeliensis]|uniref:DUF481 domain-containing protein n=1 Tax=Francisella adeliensis TaxID=2007306 RepID=A0A2Z4XX98_9GAMM|nr:DUF481 domain-containing protein [Francisella adeliensis]AXA33369.1 hypothetical protein CDH04_02595 [Francisella adeliensis]MBK2085383.1 DUF481 domain-containing protein [Francisella adeliensis]MBK2097113.1 DUF481 domain-containing protein [Francisella adeliensis]QIW11597.1 DUF481 domain-containing protein [Francisella adeliensis]QIW13472.1 DUF481 domain-containing protein [Francisella adeliensis]